MVVRSNMSRFFRLYCGYKILLGLLLVITMISIAYWMYVSEARTNAIKCFTNNHDIWDVKLLEDVMESERKPRAGKSIFFHETSCSNGIVKLNARYKIIYFVNPINLL